MATVKRFEDLAVWNAATELAVSVFKLTESASFRFKGDLVNQLRRAALSVANNIAEGFERGTTSELVTFLYISRGSAGEVRSMLHFALRLGEMADRSTTASAPGGGSTGAVEAGTAPKCPACGRDMVRRRARDGKEFWGCSAYPQCRGSRSV